MRLILLAVTVSGMSLSLMGQAITEFGAATAGTAVGTAAGKKLSDGINNVFDKVDKQTAAAASATAASVAGSKSGTPAKSVPPLLEVSPGVVGTALPANATPKAAAKVPVTRAAVTDTVPAPPALPGETIKRVETPKPPPPVIIAAVAPPPPPPPVTPEDLRGLTVGQPRADVLKMGSASARISMFEDGHLLEIYRYMTGDFTFGVVRVSDGAVSQIDVR